MSARVLVIDDSPMLIELMLKALTASGVEAVGAMDLASLDERLASGAFDLILVDVNMPEMFGDDVVEFLRTQRKVTSKLVLYSDISEEDLSAKAKSSGADGFIIKTRGVEAALAEIARLLGLTLAASSGQKTPPAAPSPPATSTDKRKRRVLIVDDSEMTARLLEADLLEKGFDVSIADTADKATKIILKKQTRPDLVLLDVRMPNVNGEQFCRFIKSNSLFAGIKVLLCSSENVEELQRICREAGADGYVPKDSVLSKVLAKELL
ncbi:MAG: response regulator [Myxococcaceae bacterium]